MKRGEGGEIKIKVISEPGNPSGAKAESEGQPGERGLLHKITKILLQFLFFSKERKRKEAKEKERNEIGLCPISISFFFMKIYLSKYFLVY